MNDEFGGVMVETPDVDEFGGVRMRAATDEFGGVAVNSTPRRSDEAATNEAGMWSEFIKGVISPEQPEPEYRATPRPVTEAEMEDYVRAQRLAAAPNLPFSPEAGTELTTTLAEHPLAPVEMGLGALALPGKLAYLSAADLMAAYGDPEHGREYGGNLKTLFKETPGTTLPVDRFIGEVAKYDRGLAVQANVAKALPELASMMMVNPQGAAGRLLAAGFSADMIYNAKPLFEEYAAEINKPEAEQDAGKRAQLEAGILQTFAFAPLAGAHAIRGEPAIAARPDVPTPVAEAPATLEAQVAATRDPYNPKAVTLVTPGEAKPEAKGLVSVATALGEALVNADKVDPKLAKAELDAGRGGQLLGMSTAERPAGGPVLETKTAEGVPVQHEVVTPATLPAAIEAGQAVAPEGTQQLKPAAQVIAERISQGTQSEVTRPGEAAAVPEVPTAAAEPRAATPAAAAPEFTERQLAEARKILASQRTERPPDIFDDLDSITRRAIKFPEEFKDTVARARGVAKERMNLKEGEPADQVLKALALENRRYAEWSVDDLANTMLDAAAVRGGSRKVDPEQVRQVARELARRGRASEPVTDWDQAVAATRAEKDQMLVGSYTAEGSTGGLNPNFPVLLGGMEHIRPMETPEILRLARELTGSVPAVKRMRRYLGMHKGGKLALDDRLFADPVQTAQVLAHELGHANDFFPEGTMKRGNLIGRLIGSTRKFLEGNYGWLNDKKLRQELIELSAYWHPWERDKAPESYRKYRDSAKELYADALSVLLNSPGLLREKAFMFYKAFFDHLDKKPKFKEEFFALQDLLSRGPEAVLGERLAQSREGFEKAEATLHEKILERQSARNSFKDFLTKVRTQSLDIADAARRKLKGSGGPGEPSEFNRIYEEWKLDDNRNAADLQRIYHEMIQPVTKAGMDEHTFGQVLELQRIMGGLDAYRDMQAMRKTLGPDRMTILQRASDTLAELERKGVAEEQAIDQVIVPLERAGIPFELIDRYRQLRETQGTRAELANPQGRSPVMAEAELNQLLAGLQPQQRAALLEATAKFRNLIFERATEAADVGIINKLTYEKTVVPNKDNYAAFRPLDKIEPYVSPMVRRAKGTLNDIENPFITTLLKLQSMNNLIELQRAKNSLRDSMQQLFPGEFTRAETRWTGRGRQAVPAKPGEGRISILENGRPVEYNTDPYIAKTFDQLTPTDSFWLNKLLEVPFRLGIYPLIIKYNPGFLFAFNPKRDLARTVRNLYSLEGVTRRELLPNYASAEVRRGVSDYLAGRPNALADAMIKNKAITTSWQGFSRIDQQDVMTDLLRRYKLAATPERNAALRTLMWLPNKINEAGSFLEALPKFASYKTLIERGIGPERAAYLVRNYAGTPNFKVKGEFANVQNSYLPFMNIFLQGWRSDLKLATSPKTAGGWWLQWAMQHGWQATMAALAVAGVFGPQIQQQYQGVSEYDLTNYGVLPLGQQTGKGEFGRKTVYLRFPRDETSRLFSAITYKATRAMADRIMGNPERPDNLPTEIFAFGAGVVPSPTPVLNVAGAWKDYLAGRNPVDPFRNRPVIGDRAFKAGGTAALGDMATWTLNQSGALNLFRWNPQSETTSELALSGTPIVNRLVKVSDQGYREAQLESERLDATAKAKLRIQYGDAAQALTARHAWLQSLGAKRTPEQNALYGRIHAWVTQFYQPADEAAWNMRENKGEQRKVVEEINRSAERYLKEFQTAR